MSRHDIIIHGHFYQPPREDPWLELVPRELSAAPDHDWNERITASAIAPLTHAPVTDAQGRIVRVVNAYAWCSFDIGPSLFRWLDDHAVDVRDAIVAGDRESRRRVGSGQRHGDAVPSRSSCRCSRDATRSTEVRWGIRDFRNRFGREPAGMWLPETAVDDETLEVLADEADPADGPRAQSVDEHAAVRTTGTMARSRRPRTGDLRLRRTVVTPDRIRRRTGERGAVGGQPHGISAGARPCGPTIVSVATDGETFGHHHRFGDLALASLIDRIDRRSDATLTNFAAMLDVLSAR